MSSKDNYLECSLCHYHINDFYIEAMLQVMGFIRCVECGNKVDNLSAKHHLEKIKNNTVENNNERN